MCSWLQSNVVPHRIENETVTAADTHGNAALEVRETEPSSKQSGLRVPRIYSGVVVCVRNRVPNVA